MYSVSSNIDINTSPSVVYHALTNQDLLSKWFAPQVIAVPVEGTVAAFAFEFDLNFKMKLSKLIPGKLVQWVCVDGYADWLDTEVIFKLTEQPGFTKVAFSHNKLKNDEKKEKTEVSWQNYLTRLKELCETSSVIL